jgi:hypothetical protein
MTHRSTCVMVTKKPQNLPAALKIIDILSNKKKWWAV